MLKLIFFRPKNKEAKNTESLVKLTEQNKNLSKEKTGLESKVRKLEDQVIAFQQQRSEIDRLKTNSKQVIQSKRFIRTGLNYFWLIISSALETQLSKLTGQFDEERQCRLNLERELSHMEKRLREQAKAECDAAAVQGDFAFSGINRTFRGAI